MFTASLVPAYILHRHKYGETSLLLDVFSKDHGRINMIAKGARRNKKQQSVTFEPYQPYRVSWIAKTELGTLTNIETERQSLALKSSQFFSGFYMNELIIYLLHKHEPHPDLFDVYETTLLGLSREQPAQIILRYFEKKMLCILGYGLVLDVDVETGAPVSADKQYCYKFEHGPVGNIQQVCPGLCLSGKTLIGLDKETLTDDYEIHEAKHLLRSILSRYLGNKKLASRELYSAFIKAGAYDAPPR